MMCPSDLQGAVKCFLASLAHLMAFGLVEVAGWRSAHGVK
jgi:hypothetical protein